MPIPTGFDNKIRRVTASPVAASDLNTEIAAQNTAGYWISDIKFTDANNAFLLVAKSFDTTTWGQKVNLVTQTQAALDADKATEEGNGNYPTGVFVTPGGGLLVLYQQLIFVH